MYSVKQIEVIANCVRALASGKLKGKKEFIVKLALAQTLRRKEGVKKLKQDYPKWFAEYR